MSPIAELESDLFDLLERSCLAEGGDGDSAFVGPNYKKVADSFEEWLKYKKSTWWTRSDSDGWIRFSNNQEAIHFTDTEYPFFVMTIKNRYLF